MISLILVVIAELPLLGQTQYRYLTPTNLATGQHGLLRDQPESIVINPSSYLKGESTIHGFITGRNSFGTDIFGGVAGVSLDGYRQGWSLLMGTYGIEGFSSNVIRGGYRRRLSQHHILGLQVEYQNQQRGELSNSAQTTASLGFSSFLDEKWSYSIVLSELFGESKDIAAVTSARYQVSEIFAIGQRLRYEDSKISYAPSIDYQFMDEASLLIAHDTLTGILAWGSEISLNQQWRVTMSYETRSTLGNSTAIGINYQVR